MEARVPPPPAPDAEPRQILADAARVPTPAVSSAETGGRGASETPGPVWILAILGAIALAAGLVAFAGRWFGWSIERFTRPFEAAAADAGGRAADAAAGIWDRLRLRR
jgi:hypothetical protein